MEQEQGNPACIQSATVVNVPRGKRSNLRAPFCILQPDVHSNEWQQRYQSSAGFGFGREKHLLCEHADAVIVSWHWQTWLCVTVLDAHALNVLVVDGGLYSAQLSAE